MRDNAKREFIPTLGGDRWICVILGWSGMVHQAFYTTDKFKKEYEDGLIRRT